MVVSLNGVILSSSLNWVERYNSHSAVQEVRRTLTGRAVIHSAPLVGGRDITLMASEDSGWLTKRMVDSLIDMAGRVGEIFTLTYADALIAVPVVFRHHEPPALELKPLIQRLAPQNGDYWTGTIKLISI